MYLKLNALVGLFAGIAILSALGGCGQKREESQLPDSSEKFALLGTGGTALVNKRVHLLEFQISGYSPLLGYKTNLDVGIEQKTSEEGNVSCRILSPRPSTAAARHPAAPFDFYGNVLTVADMKASYYIPWPKDIFYPGDDYNRNGLNQSHQWTIAPPKEFGETLEFLERELKKDEFTFFVRFTRGNLKFQGMLRTRVIPVEEKGCVAVTYLCTDIVVEDGAHACRKGQWNFVLHELTGVVDKTAAVSGTLAGYFSKKKTEREKNDLSELTGVVSRIDERGLPVGERFRLPTPLATK